MAHLILLISALGTATAPPPVTHDSVEWSCQSAAEVVVGRITEVIDSSGRGKSRGLTSVFVEGRGLMAEKASVGVYPIGLRHVDRGLLATYQKKRTPLVFFLSRTKQSYGLRGHSFDLWPLRDPAGKSRMIPLDKPGVALVGARSQAVLTATAALAKACGAARAARADAVKRGVGLVPAMWKVPTTSPLYRALGCKGACLIRVPKTLLGVLE